MEQHLMTLEDIKPGNSCVVRDVTAQGPLGQRLMDLGFFPGVHIDVIRNAPLVDPVEVKLDGFSVSIRHEEAAAIEVNAQ
jgi:ferrous iron transport protein A